MPARILVVEDELIVAHSIKETLERSNYQVVALALSKDDAIQAVDDFRPDVVLMDIRLDDENAGIEAAAIIRARFHTPIIYLTAYADEHTLQQAKATEPFGFLTKPFTSKDLYTTIEIALYKYQTDQELRQYRDHLEEMVRQRTRELTLANAQLQQEIHDRRQVQDALQRSADQYRALLEHVADGILILQHHQPVFVNRALCEMFEYPHAEFLRQTELLAMLNGGSQPERVESTAPDRQVCCPTCSGQHLWVSIQHSTIDWQGQTAILATVRDISRQKEHEQAVEQERARLQQAQVLLGSTLQDRYRFGDILGKSQAMQAVYETILQAAESDDNVLIVGESGTGKELIAQTIHHLSRRRTHAMVPVNCGAIPAQLFESEVFGHRKGAFTGAYTDKPGFFDAAQHGTLFLDEVGELDVTMQVKLLRALDGQGYVEVGGQTARHADVRIIAATNRNVEEMLQSGVIREDFFYRIHVLVIRVPPLRDRKDDILLLAEHFLQTYRRASSRPNTIATRLPGEVVDQLYHHSWPGNVRELQNVLRRYVATQRLDFNPANRTVAPQAPERAALSSEHNLRTALDDVEKQIILTALRQHAWHRAETAEALGLPVRTLHRKLKKHQLILPYHESDQ